MADLVIRGATVDVAIEDGCFSAIGPELPGARREIDGRGLTLLPGLIDVHLHFNEPGRAEWEGIATGSRALAAGGGTLFFDMPLNSSPCTVDESSFDQKRTAMEQLSITDFGLWGGLTPGSVGSLDELADCGVIGFKAFLCDSGLAEFPRADDLTLYDGMRVAARRGLPVAVHAESEELTKGLGARIRATGGRGVRDYLDSRPVLAELEAIQRAALIAKETGAMLHIVHVSSGRGVALAAQLRADGADLTIETCPHYLFFTDEDLEQLGAVAKCSPPLRPFVERAALRLAVERGDVDIVGSDHSPSSPDLKQDADFFRIWGGIAGVQSTLGVLVQEGFSVERIVQLTAGNPARRFAVRGKGAIAVGLDADCTLVDLNVEYRLRSEDLQYRHKSSPYVGRKLRGVVRRTLRRGVTIFEDGRFPDAGRGRMITRNSTCKD